MAESNYNESFPMTPLQAHDALSFVSAQMGEFVLPFTTRIAEEDKNGLAAASGTGSYFKNSRGQTFVLSAAHVLSDAQSSNNSLTHLPNPAPENTIPDPAKHSFVSLGSAYETTGGLIDCVSIEANSLPTNSLCKAIHVSLIEQTYSLEDEEYLFFAGYPGTTLGRHDPISKSKKITPHFDHLEGTPRSVLEMCVTATKSLPKPFDSKLHFVIPFESNGLSSRDGLHNAKQAVPLKACDSSYVARSPFRQQQARMRVHSGGFCISAGHLAAYLTHSGLGSQQSPPCHPEVGQRK